MGLYEDLEKGLLEAIAMEKGEIPVKLPKFVDKNNLPKGYYDEVNPHMQREKCTINIKKLFQYIKENNCDIYDITAQEAEFFMNKEENSVCVNEEEINLDEYRKK